MIPTESRVRATLAAFLAIAVASGAAAAGGPKLEGRYRQLVDVSCVASTTARAGTPVPQSGFETNLASRGLVVSFSANGQGVSTFNGDGTGSVAAKTVPSKLASVRMPTLSRVPALDIRYSFTYAVARDGVVRFSIDPHSFIARYASDSSIRPGQICTVDRIVLEGRLSADNRVLTLTSAAPAVETLMCSNGDVVERICQWRVNIILDD